MIIQNRVRVIKFVNAKEIMKVLIVDNERHILMSLGRCLSDLGYDIECCDNAIDAKQSYEAFRPDLLIADISLPVAYSVMPFINKSRGNTAGLELLKYIRLIKKESTPVMVVSCHSDEGVFNKSFELGVNDYAKMPLSISEIEARVKRLTGSMRLCLN